MSLPIENYIIDIVFVVDATNGGAIIDNVKEGIKQINEQLYKGFEAWRGISREQLPLREKLVFFGDYATEADKAIIQTEFFDMATQKEEFEKQLEREDIKMRGGDSPENGLEALFTAINSDWTPIGKGVYGRHVIVLISDAYPLRLYERDGCPGYVADDFPSNVAELESIWNESDYYKTTTLSRRHKRLILCVPGGEDYHRRTWQDVSCWEHVSLNPVELHGGCSEARDVGLFHSVFEEIFRSE